MTEHVEKKNSKTYFTGDEHGDQRGFPIVLTYIGVGDLFVQQSNGHFFEVVLAFSSTCMACICCVSRFAAARP